MLQIEPRKFFPLTWNVPDPTDTATYYVRAYIYVFGSDGARTQLETVDLTDNGDKTFIARYQMPSDPSGQGRPVVIIYRAFTDSGYTTAQELYAQPPEEKYLVKTFSMGGGGFSGAEINYDRIKKMIRLELKKLPKPVKQKEVSLDPVLEAIKNIPQPEKPKEINLTPIIESINKVQNEVKEKEPNLTPVLGEISKAKLDKAQARIESVFDKIKTFFTNDMKQFQQSVDELKEAFDKRTIVAVNVNDNSVVEKKRETEKKEIPDKNNFSRGFSQ